MKQVFKSVKRKIRDMHKKGILGKLVVIIASLALIATSILPYII